MENRDFCRFGHKKRWCGGFTVDAAGTEKLFNFFIWPNKLLLHSISQGLIDKKFLSQLEEDVAYFAERHAAGAFGSELWSLYEAIDGSMPPYLTWYNVIELRSLTDTTQPPDDLTQMMNNEVREYLGIIPDHVVWIGKGSFDSRTYRQCIQTQMPVH